MIGVDGITADPKPGPVRVAALIGCRLSGETREQAEESLEELALLVDTAGGEEFERILLDVQRITAATYIGSGQLERLAQLAREGNVDFFVVDAELSPTQQRNIESQVDRMVMDRTGLILDIFASRARTKEGKLQVELAQLQYLLPRLRGMWTHLSRQGAGIGTRGPGETDLEVDRRRISQRIDRVKRDIEKVKKTRALHRRARLRLSYPTVVLVGYTNAGKSTLLNHLTGSTVLAEDKLFATLDPTVRELRLENGERFLLSDTVGFIRRLPHQLVESFSATFEEIVLADLLVHVVDASNPAMEEHVRAVRGVLEEIGVKPEKVLTALNKIDQPGGKAAAAGLIRKDQDAVALSAETGQGTEELIEKIAERLSAGRITITVHLPYSADRIISRVKRQAKVMKSDYREDGVVMRLEVDRSLANALKEYEV